MKNRFKIIVAALLIVIPALSFAQKATKFGHVNKQDIIQVLPDRDTAIIKLQRV